MKPFLLALFLAFSSLTAYAHPLDRAKVPKGWSRCVPKGDVVWNFRRLEDEKIPTYACITYTPRRRPAKFKGAWRPELPDYLKLAIWRRSGQARPKRLNALAIDSKELLLEPLTPREVGLSTLSIESAWLKPSTRQSPLLILHGRHGNELNGDQYGTDLFLAFPGGYSRAPVKLALRYESSLIRVLTNTLGLSGDAEFTRIQHAEFSFPDQFPITSQDFLWDGSAYVGQEVVDHRKKAEPNKVEQ